MKYLIYTDVHWSSSSSIVKDRGSQYTVRLENLIKSVTWAEQLAEQEHCDEVLCLGDFFDRSTLNSDEITALQQVKFANLPHRFLVGNHEANIANLKYSTTKIFESIGAEVIDSPKTISVNDKVDLYFIPYYTEDNLKPFKEYLLDNDKKKVVLSHQDLAGIQYGKVLSSSGFKVSEVTDNCSLFLNGHLHNGGTLFNKIVLIGNLTGQNFNENAEIYNHCAYIMEVKDDGSIELEPRINPHAFNFYKVSIATARDLMKLNSLKSNAVVSAICNMSLVQEVEKALNKPNIVKYRITAMYSNNIESSESIDFSIEDHLKLFIDFAQTKIENSDILTEELSRLGG